MNDPLVDKLILAKHKFTELCQERDYINYKGFDNRFAVIDCFMRSFKSVDVDYFSYWHLIKNNCPTTFKATNVYQVCTIMIDFMIRCAKFSAFL